ncbi:MAG: DUF2911 domain-containing protein [Candidatus Hydrogenedentota bacterium]
MKVFKSISSLACVVMAVTVLTFAPQAQAEDPVATELSVSGVEDWVGLWKVTTEIMDREFILFLNIAEVEGKLGATLDMEGNPEPRAFASMAKTENGIELDGELLFMGSIKVEINMKLQFDDENVIYGVVKNPGGFFESPLTGEPLTQVELDSVQGKRRAPTEAQIRVGKKTVRLAFSGLERDSVEWDQLQNTKDGEIFQFTLHRAMKIYTEFDLTHGDTTIKKENFAPDYPGVYSVWLKKVAGGWSLVFNSQPDIWGSRHNAEFDEYEVPMTVSTVEGDPAETYRVEMEQDGDNANLDMFWGDQKWSTTFEIVQ